MENQNEFHRHIMLSFFKKDENASKTTEETCSALRKEAVSVGMVQRWFTKFRSANISVQDLPRSGRSTEIKNNEIKMLVDENPQSTAQDTPDTLNIAHSSVIHHLHEIGYVSRLNVWVPHDLTEAQLARWTGICSSFDEKRMFYHIHHTLQTLLHLTITFLNL